MNAQEKLQEYAEKHNDQEILTHQQFLGKMVVEGIVIKRTPGTMIVANIKREGQTIVVTETKKFQTHEVVNGALVSTDQEETEEVMRIEL